MEYVDYSAFLEMYPIGKGLAGGTFGEVYATLNDMVVKRLSWKRWPGTVFVSALREIHYGSTYSHPNILTGKHWTFRCENTSGEILIAQERAQEELEYGISDAHACDLLSATTFLAKTGATHMDDYVHNAMVKDGHAVLIDFGVAETGALYDRGYLVTHAASLPIAPSVGIIEGDEYHKYYVYVSEAAIAQVQFWRDAPLPSTCTLVGGTVHSPAPFPDVEKDPSDLADIVYWLYKMCKHYNLPARSLFQSIHLLHRAWGTSIPRSRLASAVFYLGCWFTSNPDEYVSVLDETHCSELEDICIVTRYLNGIIQTVSYWDYASSVEDLPYLMYAGASVNYGNRFPYVTKDLPNGKLRKDVRMSDVPVPGRVTADFIEDKASETMLSDHRDVQPIIM